MLRIPERYAHFIFGVIQSAITSAIAAGVASAPFLGDGTFVVHWLRSGTIAWFTMLPVVLFAAPWIRRLVGLMTQPE